MPTLKELGIEPLSTGPQLRTHFEQCSPNNPGSFIIVKSKGADAQTTIQTEPDEWYIHKDRRIAETEKTRILAKAGHLLITEGQDSIAARLVAVASDEKQIGSYWIPTDGLTAEQAKALAVYLNSTPGRLQLMRYMGKKLAFPVYAVSDIANIRVPDVINNEGVCRALRECWEQTKDIRVPQYRDGDGYDGRNHPREKIRAAKKAEFHQRRESVTNDELRMREENGRKKEFVIRNSKFVIENPRPIWDHCVAKTLKSNPLFQLRRLNHLRKLLHREPHVCGKSYHHRTDELEKE